MFFISLVHGLGTEITRDDIVVVFMKMRSRKCHIKAKKNARFVIQAHPSIQLQGSNQ